MRTSILFLIIISFLFISSPLTLSNKNYIHSSEELKPAADSYGSFQIGTVRSYDGFLRAEIDDTGSMIIINVVDEKNNDLVYSFEPVRRRDFWGLCFENDNYNIWIQSGDVGIICFEYHDREWQYNPDAIRPSYITPK